MCDRLQSVTQKHCARRQQADLGEDLEKNNMVSKIGEKYGAIFHLSNFLEMNINALDEAIDKLDKKMNHKKVYI